MFKSNFYLDMGEGIPSLTLKQHPKEKKNT